MESFFNDLITIEYDAAHYNDIIIKVDGRKLRLFYMQADDIPELTLEMYNIEQVLSHIIDIVRSIKRQHIIKCEDILYGKLSDIINNDAISDDNIQSFINDIYKMRELINND